MPAQATIPSKTLNQQRWREQHFPGQNQFQTVYLSIQPYRRSWKENSNTRKVPTPKKGQHIKHLTTNPKEDNHKHTKPPTKINITGLNSHLSLISLNINGLNLP
jgi:hypothetical protein